MTLKKKLFIALFLGLVFLPVTPVMADSITVSDISKQFICQCGCNMVLLNCSHAECGSREAMTTLIKQQIAQGQSEEQIIQFFVAQYGEQVLAAPPKRGFNLMAWGLPFAAILAGGGIIYLALKKWVRQGRRPQTSAAAEAEEGDEEYRRRLENELEEFNERSFR
jgi:cytochrome c-type biogenesis protein CcmH